MCVSSFSVRNCQVTITCRSKNTFIKYDAIKATEVNLIDNRKGIENLVKEINRRLEIVSYKSI